MLLDIGAGILFSILTAHWFVFPLTWQWVLLGIGSALLPDIDVFIELAQRGRLGGKTEGAHRELLHYPSIYIPVVGAIWYFGGAPYGALFLLGLLFHFLHDSVGAGWGIKWLAPFSHKRFKLFTRKDGRFSWEHPMVFWDPEEIKKPIAEYGNDNWLKDIYLRPTHTSVVEFIGFIIAIIILLMVT